MNKKPTKAAKRTTAWKRDRKPAAAGGTALKTRPKLGKTRRVPAPRKLVKKTNDVKIVEVKKTDTKLEWHWVSVKDIPDIWIGPKPREMLVWGRIGHVKR